MRSSDPRKGEKSIMEMSGALREAVGDLGGVVKISDQAYLQATMPISRGGLGISDPVDSAAIARISALANFEKFAKERVGVPEFARAKPSPDLAPPPQHSIELSGP